MKSLSYGFAWISVFTMMLLTSCGYKESTKLNIKSEWSDFKKEVIGQTNEEDFIYMVPYREKGINKLAYSLNNKSGAVMQEDEDGVWIKIIDINSSFRAFIEINGTYYFGVIDGEKTEVPSKYGGMIKGYLDNKVGLFSLKEGDAVTEEVIKLKKDGEIYFNLLDVLLTDIDNNLVIFGLEKLDKWYCDFKTETERVSRILKDQQDGHWVFQPLRVKQDKDAGWIDSLRVVSKDTIRLFWVRAHSSRRRSLLSGEMSFKGNQLVNVTALVTTIAKKYDVTSSLNNIYLTWLDHRNEVKNFQIGFSSFPPWRMNYEVFYKRSEDGGESWTDDEKISGPLVSNWDPAIMARGNLVVAAWSSLHKPGRFCFKEMPNDLYYRTSVDGGKTWGEIKRITDKGKDDYSALKPKILIDDENIYIFYAQGISDMTKSWRAGKTKGLIRDIWEPWDIMMAKRTMTREEKEAVKIINEKMGL